MPKLQKIKRSNGSCVYSVNLPLETIEALGWEKGDELEVEGDLTGEDSNSKIILSRREDEKNRDG